MSHAKYYPSIYLEGQKPKLSSLQYFHVLFLYSNYFDVNFPVKRLFLREACLARRLRPQRPRRSQRACRMPWSVRCAWSTWRHPSRCAQVATACARSADRVWPAVLLVDVLWLGSVTTAWNTLLESCSCHLDLQTLLRPRPWPHVPTNWSKHSLVDGEPADPTRILHSFRHHNSPGINRPGREGNHYLPPSGEGDNSWSYTSTQPNVLPFVHK
jgi:hypothetical protein